MATDLFGRSSGNIPIADLARGLNSPTDNNVQDQRVSSRTSGDAKSSEAADRAYEVLQRIDATTSQQLEESRENSKAANDFYRTALRGSRKENNSEVSQASSLQSVADATQGLLKAAQTQNSFWVSISSLSDTAQSQISRAFGLSGCCEALAESAAQLGRISRRNEGVTEASRQATQVGSNGGGPGGGGGDFGGGGNNSGSGGLSGGSRNGGNRAGGGGGGGAPPSLPDMAGASAQMLTFSDLLLRGMRFITDQMSQLADTLDINPAKAFDGALATVNNYRISVRKLIHAQQGFGATNRDLEKSFMDVTSVMQASGQKSEVVREALLKNMERGLQVATRQDEIDAERLATENGVVNAVKKSNILLEKRGARMKSITVTALSTAKLLNMESGSMNSLFMDWNMHLGMSELHLAEMGRHMQDIARSTGLTGPALEQAMKSTDGVMRRLQKSGSLSIDSAKKVAEFMAAAQKHGFEGAGEFMGALGNRFALMESKMKPFLINAAAMSGNANTVTDLMQGRLLETPTGMKDMMTGITNQVRQQFAPFENELKKVGINNVSELDPTQINDVITKMRQMGGSAADAANTLELRFRSLGMEIGEVQQASRALKEQMKTPFDKIKDLEQQKERMEHAGLKNTAEYERIKKLLLEQENAASLNAFGRMAQFSEQLRASGGKPDEALIQKMLPEMTNVFGNENMAREFLQDIPGKAAKAVEDFTKKANQAGIKDTELKAKLAAKGFGDKTTDPLRDLQNKIALGDTAALQAMTEISAQTGIKEQSQQDPILAVQEHLREMRITLENILSWMSGGMIDAVGATGMKILAWGSTVLNILTAMLSALMVLGQLQMGGSLLRNVLGGGGGLMGGGGGLMGGGGGGGRFARGRRAVASGRSGRRTTAARAAGAPQSRASARGATGRATASARPRRSRRPRVRGGRGGRGSWLTNGALMLGSAALGSWMSSGGDDEGMGDGSVVDLLTQIRDILSNCCVGGGGGGGGVSTTQVPSDNGSYLSDQALDRMDNVAATLGGVQMGLFAFSDMAGDSVKSASKSAVQGVDDVTKAAVQSADDVAKAATKSVDDVAKAAIGSADDVARSAVSGLDDAARAAGAAATASKAGAQSSVAAAASGGGGGGGGSIPKPPSPAGGAPAAAASGGGGAAKSMPKPPATKSFFGRLSDSVGDAWKSTKSTVSNAAGSVKSSAGSLWQSAKSTVGGAIESTRSTVGNALESARTGVGNAVESVKGGASSAWKTTTGAVSDAYTSAKGAVSGGIEAVQNKIKAGVDVAGDYMRLASDKVGITYVKDWLSKNMGNVFPKWLKTGGSKIGKGLGNVVRGAAKYAGPIGGVLELGFMGMDIFEAANEKGVSVDDLYKEIGSIIISSGLGFLTGSMLSSGLGALLTPIPGGTMVGGILGYMAGDYVGRMLGSAISDYIGGPALGKMIFDLGSSWGWWPNKGARQADQAAGGADASAALEGAATEVGGGGEVAVEAKTADVPLEAFQVGTKEVLQSGVAQIHKGEVIIPKDVWEKIKGVGSGAFGSEANGLIGSLTNAFSLVKQSATNMFKSNPAFQAAKSLASTPAVQKVAAPIAEVVGPVAGEMKKIFDHAMRFGFRDDKPEAGLKEFLGVEQKNQADRKQISASLQGAFSSDQAREATDEQTSLSLRLKTLAMEMTGVPQIAGLLGSKLGPMFGGKDKEKSGFNFDPVVSAIEGGAAFSPMLGVLKDILGTMQNQEKATKDVSVGLEGAFSADEGRGAILESMDLETKKALAAMQFKGGLDDVSKSGIPDDVFEDMTGMMRSTDVGSGLSKSLQDMTATQKSNLDKVAGSFEGAFAQGEGKLAMQDSIDLETKKMLMPLMKSTPEGAGGVSGEAAASLAQRFESLGMSLGDIQSSTASLMKAVDFKSQGKTLSDVSATLQGAFGKDEGKTAIEDSANAEANKMSYWGTMIGAAVAGPIGAMAGFAADSYMNNMGIGEALSQTVSNIGGMAKQTVGSLGLGLFDKEKTEEAEDQGALNALKNFNFTEESAVQRSMTKSGFVDAFKRNMFTGNDELVGLENSLDKAINGKDINMGEALPKALGIFDADKTDEASDAYSDGMLKSIGGPSTFDVYKYNLDAIEKQIKSSGNEKNVVAEASRALDYDRTPSEAADRVTSSYMDYRDQMRGTVDPSYMDYRDQMEAQRGEVATLGLSRFGMETAVEQEKYGSQGTGTSILPSMNEVSNYLNNVQAVKLDQMIIHLREIRDKIPGQGGVGTDIIGAIGKGSVPPTRPGVKGIAQSFTTGAWDLAYSDQSDSPERVR